MRGGDTPTQQEGGGWATAPGPQATFSQCSLSRTENRDQSSPLSRPVPIAASGCQVGALLRVALTSRLGGGHGAPVEGGAVPRHGPHLVAAPDGDRGERLVSAHVQPGGALEAGGQRSLQVPGCSLRHPRPRPRALAAPHASLTLGANHPQSW